MELGVELDPHFGRQEGEEELGEDWQRAAEENVGDDKV